MASCPSCSRPVAIARSSCLYCGAELPAEILEAVDAGPPLSPPGSGRGGEPAPEPVATERALLVARLEGVDPATLAAATGWSALEADQHVRRGGWCLLRIEEAATARPAAERLAAHGLQALVIEMNQVRAAAEPWLVIGARFDGECLRARGIDDELSLSPGELQLVVRGRIQREYQARTTRARSLRTATLEQGFRFHLHRRNDPVPLELDPGGLEFDTPGSPGSSLLRVSGWVGSLARGCPTDDHFRFLPPALSPGTEESGGRLAAAATLRRRRGSRSTPDEPVVLDNLAQFRFYSAWRSLAERRARGG